MKEVSLSDIDFANIKTLATIRWVNKSRVAQNIEVKATIEAFINFCNANNYVVKDGKVYLKDEKPN